MASSSCQYKRDALVGGWSERFVDGRNNNDDDDCPNDNDGD